MAPAAPLSAALRRTLTMMKRLALALLCVAPAATGGCTPFGDTEAGIEPLPKEDERLIPADRLPPRQDAADPNAGGKSIFLVIKVRMVTISVPVGTASGSEELWSYLDEELVEALRSANLGRNGLRVGVARRQDWPQVAAVLTKMTGRPLRTTTMISMPGDTLPVALKMQQPPQTVFVFHDDRSLTGRDYPGGDNVVALYCTLNEDDPSRIMITGLPEIRTTERFPRFTNTMGRPMMIYRPDYYPFEGMTFRVGLNSRDVLIVGPGFESRRATSVGHRFLIRDSDGVEYETVLVLIPQVFGVPAS